jgi:hypothetical protein
MRELEIQQSKYWATTKDTREDIPFVRKAKYRQWEQALSTKSLHAIESAWKSRMRYLGYM